MPKLKKKVAVKPKARAQAPAKKRPVPTQAKVKAIAGKIKSSKVELKKSKLVKSTNGAKPAKEIAAVKTPPPKPKPLTAELIAIRGRLMTMLSEVRKDIDQEVRGASERDLAHINDTSDMASDAAEGDLSLRIAESETAEAGEIERAIEKIDNGTYGVCETCNKAIGADRMQFLPYVTLCIKCQELAEIRKRETGDDLDDLNTEGGDSEMD
jgi:DnaK suppressor protein